MQIKVSDCGFQKNTLDCQNGNLCTFCAPDAAKMLQEHFLHCLSDRALHENDQRKAHDCPLTADFGAKLCTAVDRYMEINENAAMS